MIKFTHEEIEALLHLLAEMELGSELTISETSAREKLKKIYARQILSHERRINEDSNARFADTK